MGDSYMIMYESCGDYLIKQKVWNEFEKKLPETCKITE